MPKIFSFILKISTLLEDKGVVVSKVVFVEVLDNIVVMEVVVAVVFVVKDVVVLVIVVVSVVVEVEVEVDEC